MFILNANYAKHPISNALNQGYSDLLSELVLKQDVPNKELQQKLAMAFKKHSVSDVVKIINTEDFSQVMELIYGLGYSFDVPNLRDAFKNVRALLELCNHDIQAFDTVTVVDALEIEKHLKNVYEKLGVAAVASSRIRWSAIYKDFMQTVQESDYVTLCVDSCVDVKFIDEAKLYDFFEREKA